MQIAQPLTVYNALCGLPISHGFPRPVTVAAANAKDLMSWMKLQPGYVGGVHNGFLLFEPVGPWTPESKVGWVRDYNTPDSPFMCG